MRELPSGTVTFLFTDIEGSTRLLYELGAERYAQELAAHRRVLRGAFDRHGGVEVDTQGDAFFVAFPTAPGALEAAREAQQSLQIPVRMGLHTGTPLLTEEGYVGGDIHRAARIAAVGHGRQLLVSASTAALLGPSNTVLLDLGEHRLKDLSAPERIYQAGAGAFPPLKSLNATNLPVAAGPLIGREKELASLLQMIRADRARLVALVGPGGIGKTRLALEAASELVENFHDGVWFVDLSALREADLVATAIATTLGAMVELPDHIGDKELLLVLDNFEQVIDAAPVVAELLDGCARLQVLVTTREALRVPAERQHPLEPLAEAPAVELFRERAKAHDPAFDAPHEQLAAICTALDNLPLALELAAARTKLFSPSQLLDRLGERLPLLGSRARHVPERQRTLRATIEWSYDLLEPEEQELFAWLAVFSGGFTVDAAQAVCAASLDTLESLVDRSLVRRDGDRFGMLETIREFAQTLFEGLPDAPLIATRHSQYYCELVRRSEPDLTGIRQSVAVAGLAADYENVRKAFAHAAESAPEDFLGAVSALAVFWYVRSLYREGRDWLERALATAPRDDEARARALWGLGCMRLLSGDPAHAAEPLQESVTLSAARGDETTEARGHSLLGLLALFTNDLEEARRLFEEAVKLARGADDAWCLADALGTLATIYPLQGDFEPAEEAGREGLEIARRNLDEHGIRMSLFGLALTASRRGEHALAEERAQEGLEVSRSLGDLWFSSYFLWLLADAALARKDGERSLAYAVESVELADRIDAPLLLSCALDVRARAALERGDEEAALRDATLAVELSQRPGVLSSYKSAALLTLGLVSSRRDRDAGRTLLDRAQCVAEEVGDVWAQRRAAVALRSLDLSR